MSETLNLSASLEDYLEVIFHLVAHKHVARVKDIASRIQVKNSSVTGALRALADKGLIHYAPYDVVTLTDKGLLAAEDVVRRHEVLKDFFVNVLAVRHEEADLAACKMEHTISPEILERFVQFTEYITLCPRRRIQWEERLGFRCEYGNDREKCDRCISSLLEQIRQPKSKSEHFTVQKLKLHELRQGHKAKVIMVRARGEINKRILEMDIIPGSLIEMEHLTSTGDSMQVKFKGYHLLIRKEEAECIEVEPIFPVPSNPLNDDYQTELCSGE